MLSPQQEYPGGFGGTCQDCFDGDPGSTKCLITDRVAAARKRTRYPIAINVLIVLVFTLILTDGWRLLRPCSRSTQNTQCSRVRVTVDIWTNGYALPQQPLVVGQQLGQALQGTAAGQHIEEMAQKLGVDPSQVLGQLAQHLPDVVNHLTPNGEVPSGGGGGFNLDELSGLASKLGL